MNDNYYMDDLIASLEREVVVERYYPLIPHKEALTAVLHQHGAVRKDQLSDAVIEDVRILLGEAVSNLFARFVHLYDFNPSKLREIRDYAGKPEYDQLAALLRLPGVRLLRAELYFHSGVTLELLAEKSTEDIRALVRTYIQREARSETVPRPKEVNCHRAVAKMLLHTEKTNETEREMPYV